MKNWKLCLLILCCIGFSASLYAQDAAVKIDGQLVYLKAGNSLPYWLKAGQTIAPSKNVSFLSAMEFNSDSTNHILKYDQVIKIASLSTVPTGKVWKIEAVAYDTVLSSTNLSSIQLPANSTSASSIASGSTSNTPVLYQSPKKYSTAGTYQWVVPPGVTSICIEIWGGGGPGGMSAVNSNFNPSGGGGGGGYGYQCFTVVPGTIYSVVVGGEGGTSSVGTLIYATGGTAGVTATNAPSGGGSGGTASSTFFVNGENGISAVTVPTGSGGKSYNGGIGGIRQSNYACSSGIDGSAPGGGGSGCLTWNCSPQATPGKGAPGQVIIYW